MNIAVEQVSISMTAAAAEEFCPTVAAFFLTENVRAAEFFRQLGIFHAIKYVAEHVVFASGELMARIEIAVGRHCKIFMTGTAAAESFGYARAVFEVDIEMEEEKAFAFFLAFQIDFREFIVFGENRRQVFFSEAVRRVFKHYRFYGQNIEAFVRHAQYVFGKVHIAVGECAAQIIIFAVAGKLPVF